MPPKKKSRSRKRLKAGKSMKKVKPLAFDAYLSVAAPTLGTTTFPPPATTKFIPPR